MNKPFPRYFTHVEKFFDETAFIKVTKKQVRIVRKDGSQMIAKSLKLANCTQLVTGKEWKEITRQEAESLVKKGE